MSIPAVFCASVSALSFEVLLNRAFSMTQWSHLAFLVISIALFGYSAGGLTVNIWLMRKGKEPKRHDTEVRLSLLLALLVPVSWICANALPFDSIQLPFSAMQVVYFLLLYLFLSVPFYLSGFITAYSFWRNPEKTGYVYAASMAGSALGALIPAILLPAVGFHGCIVISGCISAAPAAFSQKRLIYIPSALVVCIVILTLLSVPQILEPKPSSYKDLRQYLLHPGAHISQTSESIHGRMDVLQSTSIRYAPGLSLNFRGELPKQSMVFIDNGASLVVTDNPTPENTIFVKSTLAHAPFTLVSKPSRILVTFAGGGHLLLAVLTIPAAANGITIYDQIPDRAGYVAEQYKRYGPHIQTVPFRIAAERANGPFDIIAIDHIGSSNPALSSLNEDYMMTEESIASLYESLSEKGVMVIMRRLLVPPSDSLKVTATVYNSLLEFGIEDPSTHLAMLRSWDSYLLLVTRKALGEASVIGLKSFAEANSFDLVYLPGMEESEANRFNRRSTPIHYQTVHRLIDDLQHGAGTFTQDYYMDIEPVTDNRPFINRQIRWKKVRELYNATGERFYTMLFAGEVLIATAFGVALILTILFFITPAVISARAQRRRGPPSLESRIHRIGTLSVFLLLGAGYMFFEISWIKKMIMLSGGASLSFAAVLTVVLICSGIGGFISQKASRRHIIPLCVASAATVFLSAIAMKWLFPLLPSLAHPLSLILGCTILIPPAVFLGMPLPLTMRLVCRSGRARIAGWVANGVSSVLASIFAAGIATLIGIIELLLFSVVAYVLVCLWLIVLRKSGSYPVFAMSTDG